MPNQQDLSRGPDVTPAEPQLLTKTQLARTMGVTPRTIDNWVRRRIIPSIPISARCRRFLLGSVMAALRRYETGVVDRQPAAQEANAKGGAR
jgi:hypothetical protein